MKERHSIDESLAPELAKAQDGTVSNKNESHELDSNRRRLLRGGAALAPMVLTLRSGALAAAVSGSAASIRQTTLNADGVIENTLEVVEDLANPQVCVTGFTPTGEKSVRGGSVAGVVKRNPPAPDGKLSCMNFESPPQPLPAGNVAILSAGSVASLIP